MNPTTQALIDRVVMASAKAWAAQDATILPLVVEQVLREQDRNTRHACAEAVCFSTTEPRSVETNAAITRAHQACINAVSV